MADRPARRGAADRAIARARPSAPHRHIRKRKRPHQYPGNFSWVRLQARLGSADSDIQQERRVYTLVIFAWPILSVLPALRFPPTSNGYLKSSSRTLSSESRSDHSFIYQEEIRLATVSSTRRLVRYGILDRLENVLSIVLKDHKSCRLYK